MHLNDIHVISHVNTKNLLPKLIYNYANIEIRKEMERMHG